MKMGSESNSDGEEKKDASSSVEKEKGKKPMDNKTGSRMDSIIEKAKGMLIDEAKALIAAKSKGKEAAAAGSGYGSKGCRGKQIENVVKSCYSLRSGSKTMDIDVKPTIAMAAAGEKRKASERRRDFLLSRQACKKVKGAKKKDDETDDKDGTGTAARATRLGNQEKKVL